MTTLAQISKFFRDLLSSTHGQGPSCTRLIYLLNGLGAAFCSVLATIGGIMVYCESGHHADITYWGGVSALWTSTLAFGALTKRAQQKATKEIEVSKQSPVLAHAMSGD